MSKSRIISLFLAVIAAFLVAYAGKACAQDINNTNKKKSSPVGTSQQNGSFDNNIPDYSYGTVPPETTVNEYEGVETVTNLFGEVVATVPAASDGGATAEPTTKNTSILDRAEPTTEAVVQDTTAPIAQQTETQAPTTNKDHPLLGEITTAPPVQFTTESNTLPSNIVIQIY